MSWHTGVRQLLYTTQPGGLFKFGGEVTHDQFAEIVATRSFDATPPDVDRDHDGFVATIVRPYFVAIVEVTECFDFGLERERTSRPVLPVAA